MQRRRKADRPHGQGNSTGDPALRWDVTLVDIDLRDQSGLDVARRLHHDDGVAPDPDLHPAEEDYAELIAASPTTGFLPKAELSVGATRALLGRADDGGQVSGRRGT